MAPAASTGAVATAGETHAPSDEAVSVAAAGALEFTAAEVEHSRSFLRETLLEELVRLYPSWGFCARHAWGCAITELELHGRLFTTAILYDHLLERAVGVAVRRRRRWRSIRASLRPYAECYSCEHLASVQARGEERRYGTWAAELVGKRQRTHDQLAEARHDWVGRACPLCVEGGGGLVCRPHLVAGAQRPDDLSLALSALYARLGTLIGSMTASKTPTTPLDRFSWVETLSWFGGWEHAEKLLREERR